MPKRAMSGYKYCQRAVYSLGFRCRRPQSTNHKLDKKVTINFGEYPTAVQAVGAMELWSVKFGGSNPLMTWGSGKRGYKYRTKEIYAREFAALPSLPSTIQDTGVPMNLNQQKNAIRELLLGNTPKKNITGYTGVTKNGKRFQAKIYFDRRIKCLGTYDTPKEAALAYDRAVVQHKLPSIKLNFPNDHTSSDGSSNDGSSDDGESDDGESDDGESDDGESDDDDALAPPPSPQARPYFERDPMLDQLVAEELHKRQKINKCGSMDTWIPVQEGAMISSV